jgi:hypothetical protein
MTSDLDVDLGGGGQYAHRASCYAAVGCTEHNRHGNGVVIYESSGCRSWDFDFHLHNYGF